MRRKIVGELMLTTTYIRHSDVLACRLMTVAGHLELSSLLSADAAPPLIADEFAVMRDWRFGLIADFEGSPAQAAA